MRFASVVDRTFQAFLDDAEVVVLKFWSASCAPCLQLDRVIKRVADELPDSVLLASVAADENPELVHQFAVRSVPTLVLLRRGDVLDHMSGVDRPQVLKRRILNALD